MKRPKNENACAKTACNPDLFAKRRDVPDPPVPKDELLRSLWPDCYVDQNSHGPVADGPQVTLRTGHVTAESLRS